MSDNDKKCGGCRFWAQTGGPPKEQRGPVILAAQGQSQPLQGECRRELRVSFVLVPAGKDQLGQPQLRVEPVSGYGPCPDTFPACGEFRERDKGPGEVIATKNDDGNWDPA